MNKLPTTSGVYKITCTVNGKIYVGRGVNIQRRWKRHKVELRANQHRNTCLQRDWNNHGESAFAFEIIEACAADELVSREQHYLDTLRPFDDRGFNISRSANIIPLGREVTPEHRAKISAAKKGKSTPGHTNSPETRAKISAALTGKPGHKHTPESLSKLSAASKKAMTPEARNHLSEVNKGKVFSPEHRAKLSASKKGKPKSAEHVAKIRASKCKYIYIITDPQGVEYETQNLNQFCKEHSLDQSSMWKIVSGVKYNHKHKGWTVRKVGEIT